VFIPSSKDVVGEEGVARDMESFVDGTGLLGRDGDRGGVDDEAVK